MASLNTHKQRCSEGILERVETKILREAMQSRTLAEKLSPTFSILTDLRTQWASLGAQVLVCDDTL